MMREALDSLGDPARVKRLLVELGRFYDPVADGPVVGPDVRRDVIDSLGTGDVAGARRRLEAHLDEHLRRANPSAQAAPGGRA